MLPDQHFVVYGKKTIAFNLIYSNRKTMQIAVQPNQSIIVKVPIGSDRALIEKKLIKKARWIFRQQNYFKQFEPKTPERCFVNGETHLYLGKQYRLKIIHGTQEFVKLSKGFFYVSCRNSNRDRVKKLLFQWYMEKAQLQFIQSMNRCWQKTYKSDIGKPKLLIKKMKTRWGSFSNNGKVILNIDLIQAPKECIDYVIIHELCHLKYRNHSKKFYSFLETIMPNWKNIKHKLETIMA